MVANRCVIVSVVICDGRVANFLPFFFLCAPPSLGGLAEQMGDLEHALSAYENALRHNPMSLSGLTQVAGIARIKENYPKVSFSLISIASPFPLFPR